MYRQQLVLKRLANNLDDTWSILCAISLIAGICPFPLGKVHVSGCQNPTVSLHLLHYPPQHLPDIPYPVFLKQHMAVLKLGLGHLLFSQAVILIGGRRDNEGIENNGRVSQPGFNILHHLGELDFLPAVGKYRDASRIS